MLTSIDNFTVTDVTFQVTEGQNVAATQASALITLTPNTGYTLIASDFVLNAPIPSEINGGASTFSQAGANVLLTAVFVDPTTMPSANLEIPLCVRGFSDTIVISLDGVYSITSTNSTPTSSSDNAYSISGDYGTTSQVLNVSLTADSGYYFSLAPTIFINTGVATDYSIATTDTNNIDGYLTSKNFTVNYTFPTTSVTGDSISINGSAISLPVVVEELVRSYVISGSNIPMGGENRVLTLTGGPNADWTVTASGTGLTFTETGVLPATGISYVTIPFPSGSGQTYTVTLAGDLLSPFPLANPFTLVQEANIKVSVTPTFTGILASPLTIFREAVSGTSPLPGTNTYSFILSYVFADGSNQIDIDTIPLNSDWVIPTLNGTSVAITNTTAAYTTAGLVNSVTLSALATVTTYGTSDVDITMDLDSFFSVPTLYPAFASSLNQGSSLNCVRTKANYYFSGAGSLPVVNDLVYSTNIGNALANGNYVLSNSSILVVVSGAVDSIVSACTVTTPILMTMSNSYEDSTGACASAEITSDVYFANNSASDGAIVYTTVALDTIFIGDGGWYRLDDTVATKAITISSTGVVGALMSLCNINP